MTLFVNWIIKPFSRAFLGWLPFFTLIALFVFDLICRLLAALCLSQIVGFLIPFPAV